LLTNSPEFIITYLAILKAGHIALPLDPAYKKLELDAIIEQVPPKLIVTDSRYSSQIGRHQAKKLMFSELSAPQQTPNKFLRLPAAEQVASLTFTSGTTGKPKVVPNTHANHIWNIKVCSEVWEWDSNDTMLLCLPLSHWYGLVMGLSGALYHGNTLYLRQQSFDAKEIIKELRSGRISLFTHVPLAYMKMLEQGPTAEDLSGVRLLISGGGPLPPAASAKFRQRFGVSIIETYGSSETGRIAANELGERLRGTPGRVLPGVNLKLTPEGEITIKSAGVFPGYYHNPEATRAGWTAEGWWRTGDLGEVKDGHVFLKGRTQERIRKFGYTISPRDIEWAMYNNPKIKSIYVMGRHVAGRPNDELVYFVVGDISRQEIANYCKENLLFAWRPDKVIMLPSLPRTQTGKPQIAKLRALAEASV
jgi:acyl-CoA synthetase (AMP-forming)/AMP-acid ligase II